MPRDIAVLYDRIVKGDRVALGQAMTIVESDRQEDRAEASTLLDLCERQLEKQDHSIRFAISGAPGVGKSTLIETLGAKAISNGHKVGVITVDPTSNISHGSILGDKSRMTGLASNPSAFIRTSPAGTILGGLGRRSFELMTMLAASGYDIIFLETVGVGQSEHAAWQVTDGFILVIQPGGGDELQGIKRGITELSDLFIVNKAEGNLAELARKTQSLYQNAAHFFSSLRSYWSPKVLTCSALTGEGIDEIWSALRLYQEAWGKSSSGTATRNTQKMFWLSWSLGHTANQLLMNHPLVREKLKQANANGKRVSLFQTEFEIENVMKTLIKKPSKDKT